MRLSFNADELAFQKEVFLIPSVVDLLAF